MEFINFLANIFAALKVAKDGRNYLVLGGKAKFIRKLPAPKRGYVHTIDAGKIAQGVRLLATLKDGTKGTSNIRFTVVEKPTIVSAGQKAPLSNNLTKADVKYMFTAKVGIGLGYWYEKLDIADYSTLNNADGSPRIDPLGAIQTGYGNRPYKGQTGLARLIFKF